MHRSGTHRGAWWRRGLGLCMALALWAGCGGTPGQPPEAVVATVGDAAITARDFVLNYEFGFGHLKRGDDPRRAYLQRMIDEQLLALEGYRLGLDASPEVQRQVAILRDELLVEQVFEQEVNRRVTVSDEEVRSAMQQDRVQFKLRYLPAATLAGARALGQEVRQHGFEDVLERRLAAEAGQGWRRGDFESGYLTWRDLDPDLLSAVSDLPRGEVSAPIPYRGSYLLVQVVDVRREPAAPVADPAERARYEQVLFQRKAKQEARRFIGEMMKPLDLRVRRGAYQQLQAHLRAWYAAAPPAGNLLESLRTADAAPAQALRGMLQDTLMTTREGVWTVEAFLQAYPVERYPLSTRSPEAFERDLYDALGLTLRDRAFIRKAEAEGLADAPNVQKELKRWQDKWVYRAFVNRMADTLAATDAEARAYFAARRERYRDADGDAAAFEAVAERVRRDVRAEKKSSLVGEALQALRARYPVEIRSAVLDTLTVAPPAGPGVLVFKGHTRRLAYPVADPGW